MKIRTSKADFDDVMALEPEDRRLPLRPGIIWRWLMKMVGAKDLKETSFTYRQIGMERLGKDEPCLILMNHSAFIDLGIASTVMFPRPMNIVCTSDGFVGKSWLMRRLGCIPTRKFMTDVALVKDIIYAIRKLRDSVLMYPEASYSFDGTATPLPAGIGKLVKKLAVPVVMIRTYGAFLRDPLYNGLRKRDVRVSADVEYMISPDDCRSLTVDDINERLRERFTFDNFQWQIDNKVMVDEPFRAEGLNRVLYKCPHCGREGVISASGTKVSCTSCGAEYELTEGGMLARTNGETAFDTVPKWYAWERECVRKEIADGTYSLDVPVSISVHRGTKSMYDVGEGRLTHGADGFHLTGCGGKLNFRVSPLENYSLYADYFWYEIGDVISIGNQDAVYYCFPKTEGDVVAKTRLATEELFKIKVL